MGRRAVKYLIDGEWTTVAACAAKLGVSVNTLYSQMNKRRVSLPALMRMYADGRVCTGSWRGERHLVRGQWTTVKDQAARLGVTPMTLWHRQKRYGETLEEAVMHYESVRDGRLGRYPARARKYWVNGRTVTMAEAAEGVGVPKRTLAGYVSAHRCTVQTGVRHYEQKLREKAEREILAILGYCREQGTGNRG